MKEKGNENHPHIHHPDCSIQHRRLRVAPLSRDVLTGRKVSRTAVHPDWRSTETSSFRSTTAVTHDRPATLVADPVGTGWEETFARQEKSH